MIIQKILEELIARQQGRTASFYNLTNVQLLKLAKKFGIVEQEGVNHNE